MDFSWNTILECLMKVSGLRQDFKMSGRDGSWKSAELKEISVTTVPENSKNEARMRHTNGV